MRFPFATEVFLFAIPLGILLAPCLLWGWDVAAGIDVGLLLFVLYFFRDPERIVTEGENILVAPGDGKVVLINDDYPSPDHPDGAVGISIFLSIFNVHIQRAPLAGAVIRKWYNKGKFLAAWDHKASLDNEQSLMVLDTAIGTVGVKQIAGLVARRIATWPNEGDQLERGERYGLIRFGSRVDLIVPKGTEITCTIGDTVTGGVTIMAKGKSS